MGSNLSWNVSWSAGVHQVEDREVLPDAQQTECLVLDPDVTPGLCQSAVNKQMGWEQNIIKQIS